MYGLIGLLTYPIGGGVVAGILYANAARDVNALKGVRDDSLWHNPFFAGAMGFVFPGIAGLCYGYAYGKKETERGELRLQAERALDMNSAYTGYGPAREMGGAYWRDRLTAEQPSRSAGR